MYTITRITYNTESSKKSISANDTVNDLEAYRKQLHGKVECKSILLVYDQV